MENFILCAVSINIYNQIENFVGFWTASHAFTMKTITYLRIKQEKNMQLCFLALGKQVIQFGENEL